MKDGGVGLKGCGGVGLVGGEGELMVFRPLGFETRN